MTYPQVHDEFETLEMLHLGYSIARFGDGEFKLMDGKDQVREPANPALAKELRQVLRDPHEKCLVAVPTMDPKGPKIASWRRHADRFAKMIRRRKRPLYSAFISRPDSAPWIRTAAYARRMEELWKGKFVSVVCENGGSALRAVRPGARVAYFHECPTHETYKKLGEIEAWIIATQPDIAILSCGPAATCLANRLAAKGIQAIDFGSGGAFIARLLAGEDYVFCKSCKRTKGKEHRDWCRRKADSDIVTEADA